MAFGAGGARPYGYMGHNWHTLNTEGRFSTIWSTLSSCGTGPESGSCRKPDRWEDAVSRIDHINNPDAPPPNSVVPSAVAFIENEHGEVLLIKRSDKGDWALPGGAH